MPEPTQDIQTDTSDINDLAPGDSLAQAGGVNALRARLGKATSNPVTTTQPTSQPTTQPTEPPLLPSYQQGEDPAAYYRKVEKALADGEFEENGETIRIDKAAIRERFGFSARQYQMASALLQDLEEDFDEVKGLKAGLQDKLNLIKDSLDAISASDDGIKAAAKEMFAKAHNKKGPVAQFIQDNKLEKMAQRDLTPDFETVGFRGKTDVEKVLYSVGAAFNRIETVEAAEKISVLVNAEYVIDESDKPSGEIADEARSEITKRLKNPAAKELYGELLPQGTKVEERVDRLGIIQEEYSNDPAVAPIAKAYTDLRLGLRAGMRQDSSAAAATVNQALEVLEKKPENATGYYEAYNRQAARRVVPGDLLNDLAYAGFGQHSSENAFAVAQGLAKTLTDPKADPTESIGKLIELAESDKIAARAVVVAINSGEARGEDGNLINLNKALAAKLSADQMQQLIKRLPSLQIPFVREVKDFSNYGQTPRPSEKQLSPEEAEKLKQKVIRERQIVDETIYKYFQYEGDVTGKYSQPTLLGALKTDDLKRGFSDACYYKKGMGPVDYLVETQDKKAEQKIRSLYWLMDNPPGIDQRIVVDRALRLRQAAIDYHNDPKTQNALFAALEAVEKMPAEFAERAELAKTPGDKEKLREQYAATGAKAVASTYDLCGQLLAEFDVSMALILNKSPLQNVPAEGGVAIANKRITAVFDFSNELVATLADVDKETKNPQEWKEEVKGYLDYLVEEADEATVRMVLHRIMRDPDLEKLPVRNEKGEIILNQDGSVMGYANANLASTIEAMFPEEASTYLGTLFPDY